MSAPSGGLALEVLTFLVGGGVGAGILKVVDTWIAKRRTPEDMAASLVATAGALMAGMREDLDALRAEVDALKAENELCRQEGEQLRQRGRELEQKLDSLMRGLARGDERPGGPLQGALIELRDGEVKVTKPAARPRRTS